MENDTLKLEDRAKSVLSSNWTGRHTIPAKGLYPHQWSWDSAFIAIGYGNYAPEKAQRELDGILAGQWKNGLLPHIIFDPKAKGYFPDPGYWKTETHSPPNVLTSGIIQPPVHAIAALKYYRHSRDKKALKRWFPRLKAFHRYLHENRDPERSGFATIYHPWESGFDNSPRWDEALASIEPSGLPEYKRSDLEHVRTSEERPTGKDYDRYIHLTEILKKHDYDDKSIYRVIPFKIKDVVFNTILYAANKALLELAQVLSEERGEIQEWISRQEDGFLKQFSPDPEEGLFYDYDLVAGRFIERRTVAALTPIYAGLVDRAIIEKTISWMDHSHFCSKGMCKYPAIPSTSLDSPYFAHITYWRGPIWINTNWMIYQGLRTYKFEEKAERLREALLDLVRENGFYEYFDPHNGVGHGGENFSWTASLTIDFIHKCDIEC